MSEKTYQIEHRGKVFFIKAWTLSEMRRYCYDTYGFYPDESQVTISEASL